MFVRTSHWTCKAELAGAALELFRTKAAPILRRQPGLLWAQLQGEPGSNRRIAAGWPRSLRSSRTCMPRASRRWATRGPRCTRKSFA